MWRFVFHTSPHVYNYCTISSRFRIFIWTVYYIFWECNLEERRKERKKKRRGDWDWETRIATFLHNMTQPTHEGSWWKIHPATHFERLYLKLNSNVYIWMNWLFSSPGMMAIPFWFVLGRHNTERRQKMQQSSVATQCSRPLQPSLLRSIIIPRFDSD